MLLLARKIGLIRDLNHNLHLLKRHLPYHESDHVLNIAFNILAGGQRLEHIELRLTRYRPPTSTPWAPSGSPIPRPKATSAVGSPRPMSRP